HEVALVLGRKMQHHHARKTRLRGHATEEGAQRLQAAGRCADTDDAEIPRYVCGQHGLDLRHELASGTHGRDKRHDHSIDLVLRISIGPDSNPHLSASAHLDPPFERRQRMQYPSRVVLKVRILHIVRQVANWSSMIMRLDVENLSERGGISLNTKVTVEKEHGDIGRRHEVFEVVVGARDLLELHLELMIHRLDLFIYAL